MKLATKDELIKMFVSGDLFSYLMKVNLFRKGDMVNYATLLDLGKEDMQLWFEKNGYPGLKASPRGGECDYVWTLRDGVYEVVFIERNLEFPEFSTTSGQEFETWWKDYTLKQYTARLEYTWRF
jgi:hypothetical protein